MGFIMVKCVLFDMDGLMFDTEMVNGKEFIRVAKEFGYDVSWDVRLKMLGRSVKDNGQMLAGIYGPDFPFAEILEKRKQDTIGWFDENGTPVKPGLIPLLEYLEDHGIPAAVCSSSDIQVITRHLERSHTRHYFQLIISGDMVKKSKPDPEIFLTGCARLGIDPADALVLEDSENGILAAENAGIPVICVPDLVRHPKEIEEKTLATVDSLSDVLKMFERGLL